MGWKVLGDMDVAILCGVIRKVCLRKLHLSEDLEAMRE